MSNCKTWISKKRKFARNQLTIISERKNIALDYCGNYRLIAWVSVKLFRGIRTFFNRLVGLRRMCEDTFLDFLQECSLIPASMKSDSCGIYMHIVVPKRDNNCPWTGVYSGNGGRLNLCRVFKSVRHSFYFTCSHFPVPIIFLMT